MADWNPLVQLQSKAAYDPQSAAIVIQTYTMFGLPVAVSVHEDDNRVVTVAGTSLTMGTS